jgi:AraC-like DNA-binding protein
MMAAASLAPPAALPMLHFGGDDLSVADRLRAWREQLKRLCEVGTGADDTPQAFQMDMTAWHLGGLVMARVHYGCGMQQRTERHIRGDGLDHYRVSLILEGTVRVGGTEPRVVRAGQILLADMAQRGHAVHSAGGSLTVFVPRESLDELLPRPVDLHGCVLSGVMGDVLAHHLRGMLHAMPQLSTEQARGLVAPTLHLLAAAIGAEPALAPSARGEVTLLRQASRYIEMNLQDDQLSPQAVAQALGVSRAKLYRLFEPLGGVAAFIKERRLVLIHEALRARGRHQSVARIAEDHGFKSAAHFSDAFLRHFGYRPSMVPPQGGGVEATVIEPATAGARTGDRHSVFHWLQTLR